MKRLAFLVGLCVVMAACGSDSPVSTAPTSAAPQVVAPPPILAANFIYGSGTLFCVTGFCSSFTMALTNSGPGCAAGVVAYVAWYGQDGAEPLPNTPTIPMGYPGGLANVTFRPGTTIVITSLGGFNDVRSAHTVYRAFATWNNVAC